MKTSRSIAIAAAAASFVVAGAASRAAAQNDVRNPFEVQVLGGIQALNENDTGFHDNFINVPLVAAVVYRVTPVVALEGEFTWMIPIEQSVSVESGGSRDLSTPNVLAYQANVRADLAPESQVSPYLVAGLGAVTFLSNDDPDRMPQLAESETAFAINFGTGITYRFTQQWGLRADFRALVAFPSDNAAGLSDDGKADEIWMERGTVGAVYSF